MPAESKAERTRLRLLDAAESVFARRGYTTATVDEIAAEAGYSIGALYSRIGGKEEVFLAVFERYLEQRLGELRAAARTTPSADDIARAWLELVRSRSERLLLFVEFWIYAARESAPGAHRMAAALRDFDDKIEEVIAQGFEAAPPDEARDAARALIALYRGFALSHVLTRGAGDEQFLADATRQLLTADTRLP